MSTFFFYFFALREIGYEIFKNLKLNSVIEYENCNRDQFDVSGLTKQM